MALVGVAVLLTTGVAPNLAPQGQAEEAGDTVAPDLAIVLASAGDVAGVAAEAKRLAEVLLGAGVALVGTPSINNNDPFSDPEVGIRAFGTFTGGALDIGIASGLIIGANAAFTVPADRPEDELDNNRNDASLAALLKAAGFTGECAKADFETNECVNNATSLEFEVVPTDRYLKFEYVLAITESGNFNPSTGAWGGAVFSFPDGFGLFVGGTTVADNCAVVPTTTTYVSMQTAGIVGPPTTRSEDRATALANLAGLIADPGSAATPPRLAYAAAADEWPFQFLTVPLTCVVDLSPGGEALPPSVPIKIVIADANDEEVPPAVFLAGESVRFSSTETPSADDAGTGGTTTPAAPTISSVTEGDGSVTVAFTAPTSDGGAPITNYEYSIDGGATWTARSPASTTSPITITGLPNGVPVTIGLRAVNAQGSGAAATSGPHTPAATASTPAPTTPGPSPADRSVAVAVEQAAGLTGAAGLLIRGGEVVPLLATITPAIGPRGGLVLEDSDGTVKVTITTAAGISPTAGVVVATDGEIVCEICMRLAAGNVVEAWVLSDPRLAAAVRVEVDAEEGTCPLLRIPVGAPLDGGGAIEPGAHTLQLRMYTEDGFEVLSVPITIGGGTPVPARINAGGGPVPVVPLGMLLVVALLGAVALTTEHGRVTAAASASERSAGLRASARHRLPAFDTLQQQLDERRRMLRSQG